MKEDTLIRLFQIIAHPSNLTDLWVYILLQEGSDRDWTIVPFNLPETLLEITNTLSSCSSHTKHLQMSPAPHVATLRHSVGQMNTIQVLTWINRTDQMDGLQKTRTRLNYLSKIRNPKSYQLARRLSWGLYQPMPPGWYSLPQQCEQHFPESPCVSLGFYSMCRNQIHSPPSQN